MAKIQHYNKLLISPLQGLFFIVIYYNCIAYIIKLLV